MGTLPPTRGDDHPAGRGHQVIESMGRRLRIEAIEDQCAQQSQALLPADRKTQLLAMVAHGLGDQGQ
jgi:hypothetical protein